MALKKHISGGGLSAGKELVNEKGIDSLIITGHDGKEGLALVGQELTKIFSELGNNVKDIIWGEGVWQKGEVTDTKAMDEAYKAGLSA